MQSSKRCSQKSSQPGQETASGKTSNRRNGCIRASCLPGVTATPIHTTYPKVIPEDEELLRAKTIELASEYGRYVYRRVTALLRNQGWIVNHKRVERIW